MIHHPRNDALLSKLAIALSIAWSGILSWNERAAQAEPPPRALPPAVSQPVDFTRDIAPILSKSCYALPRAQEAGGRAGICMTRTGPWPVATTVRRSSRERVPRAG